MAHALAQVRLANDSGLPADVFINTFHFSTPAVVPASPLIADRVIRFYTDAPDPGDVSLDEFFGLVINSTAFAHEVRVYDMDLPSPRIPVYSQLFTAGGFGTDTLPTEVALCASFEGAKVSGLDQARRRGRIYFGPLRASTTLVIDSTGKPQPALREQLARSSEQLAEKNDIDAAWCVYSRTNDLLVTVQSGWVDNAFDTQRRRGPDPTARATWSVAI